MDSLILLIVKCCLLLTTRDEYIFFKVCWDRAEHYCIAMLYLIGLGLGNVDDITVKGMAIVQKCSRVYLETYTSIMSFGLHKEKLEEFFGKEIEEADRATVELDFSNFFYLFYWNFQIFGYMFSSTILVLSVLLFSELFNFKLIDTTLYCIMLYFVFLNLVDVICLSVMT